MIKNLKIILVLIISVQSINCSYGKNSPTQNSSPSENINSPRTILKQLYYFDSIQEKDSVNYYILKGRSYYNNIDSLDEQDVELMGYGGDIYTFIANNLIHKNQFSEALFAYNKAQSYYALNNNQFKIAWCLNKKGDIYQSMGNQIDALTNYYKSNSIYKRLQDSTQIALTYVNIAKIYRTQGDYNKAQETLNQTLLIINSVENPYILCRIKNSIALINMELGENAEALSLFQEALSLAKKSVNDDLIPEVLNNIGDVYIKMEDFEKAKYFYKRGLDFATEHKCFEEGAISLNNLGKYYFYTQNYNKAIEFASKSLEVAKDIQRENVQTKAINLLLRIYKKQNNWKKAFYYQNLLIEQTKKREKKTIEQILLQEKIRLDKEKERFIVKQKEVEDNLIIEKESQHQNALYIGVGLFFVMLLTILLIIYFQLRASRERNKNITKQSEERKLLLQEVHHRVKNNFQIVSSMLRLQSYEFNGEELQSSFNEAISRINAMAIVHEVIYQQEEFRNISVKTYLQKLIKILRKTGHTKVNFIVESEEFPLNIETLISLGIILNELITNSFQHAFEDFDGNPRIKITLASTGENAYELNYKDNGVGISKELSSNFGMELIDTIISNYEGSVELINEPEWPTSIKIKFLES